MKVEQLVWSLTNGWCPSSPEGAVSSPQLVLMFAGRDTMQRDGVFSAIRSRWPEAHLLACTTGGEIHGAHATDDGAVATAIEFEHSTVRATSQVVGVDADGAEIGRLLASGLEQEGLRHVFVLSDGLHVNGSALVRGLASVLPLGVAITGGLAGDNERFVETLVGLDTPPESRVVAAIGLYGERLRVGMGSVGGWDMFGPDRLITRSSHNVLYELDGQPALELYKRYLGPFAADLPASGLLFPLAIHAGEQETAVVRTILAIDDAAGSLTFAGDMPEGMYARLMHANLDRLVDGAGSAASASYEAIGAGNPPELAILISCVGRKWVLRQRAEEELESVRDVLGGQAILTGFYSYGEISPFTPTARCELHNQTMTVTTVGET
jgi:hypothetical protein